MSDLHVALIYADIVKLRNINHMISAENQCDDFSPPAPRPSHGSHEQ